MNLCFKDILDYVWEFKCIFLKKLNKMCFYAKRVNHNFEHTLYVDGVP